MGIIRSGILIIISVVLLIVVLLGSVFSVLALSLEYENVQKEFRTVFRNLTENQLFANENFNLTTEMERARDFMILHCQTETSYVFSSGGYTFVMPCSLLEEGNQSIEEFTDAGSESILYDIYYKDYNCDFWKCFSATEIPLFLISEKAKNYWQEKFYLSLIIFAFLAFLILLLIEQKQNTPILIGSIFMISSLLLLRFQALPAFLIGEYYSQFVNVFFNKINTVFTILFISGLILFLIGISLRLLQKDLLKKKFSKEDVKEIVREEMKKTRPSVAESKKEISKEKFLKKKIPVKKLPKKNK